MSTPDHDVRNFASGAGSDGHRGRFLAGMRPQDEQVNVRCGASVLTDEVLSLNRNYSPVHVTTVRSAVMHLFDGGARALDEQHRLHDFSSWFALPLPEGSEGLRTVHLRIRVPRVILFPHVTHRPRLHVRFSRGSVFARDGHRCQYCGASPSRTGLNLDHVLPRSRGGQTSWENVVASCIACNLRKGPRTPAEAGMRLLQAPTRPSWPPVLRTPLRIRDEWRPFLV